MVHKAYATETKICLQCRGQFKAKRAWQQYCTDKCRIRHHLEEKELAAQLEAASRQALEEENARLLARVRELESLIEKLK